MKKEILKYARENNDYEVIKIDGVDDWIYVDTVYNSLLKDSFYELLNRRGIMHKHYEIRDINLIPAEILVVIEYMECGYGEACYDVFNHKGENLFHFYYYGGDCGEYWDENDEPFDDFDLPKRKINELIEEYRSETYFYYVTPESGKYIYLDGFQRIIVKDMYNKNLYINFIKLKDFEKMYGSFYEVGRIGKELVIFDKEEG